MALRNTQDRAVTPPAAARPLVPAALGSGNEVAGAIFIERSPAPATDRPASGAGGVSRRQALKAYVPPAIAVIGLPTAASLAGSGPVSRTRKGNNGFGQERQGAPKDGPPAGKPKNDKPGPR